MPTRYFKLSDDVALPGRWELGNPTAPTGREVEDPWIFREGQPLPEQGVLRIPIERPGASLDYSHAGFSIPILHEKVAALFLERAPGDVQLLPVAIQGQSARYFILNATRVVKCIDDRACKEVEYWMPEDGRPEKVGQYRDVYGMRIEPTKVGDARVFRTWGWTVALIVSEDIKQALECAGASGVKFVDVTDPGIVGLS